MSPVYLVGGFATTSGFALKPYGPMPATFGSNSPSNNLRGEDEMPFFREVAVAWVSPSCFQTGHLCFTVIRVFHVVCRYNARSMPSVRRGYRSPGLHEAFAAQRSIHKGRGAAALTALATGVDVRFAALPMRMNIPI